MLCGSPLASSVELLSYHSIPEPFLWKLLLELARAGIALRQVQQLDGTLANLIHQ